MRFSSYINNQKCLEWGLNANQGALFDLLNQASSWAQEISIYGVVFYWVAREKVIEELPLFYSKTDTVYRHFKDLHDKGLIKYSKIDGKDLIRLTDKGKTWNEFSLNPEQKNSDLNPTLGNKSENTRKQIRKSSDLNPTDKYINNKNTTDQISSSAQNADTPPASKKSAYTADDLKLAQEIFQRIQKLNPSARTPNFETWANDIRLMRERDNRSLPDIAELFRWANADNFWQSNILSPTNLRKHWDKLVMQRQRSYQVANTTSRPKFSDENTSWWKGMTVEVDPTKGGF